MAGLNTNESRHRHREAIRYVDPMFDVAPDRRRGYVYLCPRCSWVAPTMKHQVGAERHGDEHALVCLAARRG